MELTFQSEWISARSYKLARRILLILLILACSYHHLLATIKYTRVDSDAADTFMLWSGLKQYGFQFLQSWRYTQDNWLLSLLPWHTLLYSFIPFSALFLVICEFSIWGLNLVVCSLIAQSLNAKKSISLVPFLLICAGEFVYKHGYIAFMITHNITNLLGLLSLLFSIYWIQNQSKSALIGALLFSIIAGFSDPWFLPCYLLPFLITTWILWKNATNKKNKTQFFYLWSSNALAWVFIYVLLYSKVFGLFYFLTKVQYRFSFNWHEIKILLVYFWGTVGNNIQFFPIYAVWSSVASLGILIILLAYIFIQLKRKVVLENYQWFFFISAGLSMLILPLSYILSKNPTTDVESNRYFINIFVFGILTLTVGAELLWSCFSKGIKSIFLIAGLAYAISGASTIIPLWKLPPSLPKSGQEDVLNFLTSHQLTYGYADYWYADILTALSNNFIRVRPIEFFGQEMVYPNRPQTSALWFTVLDVPVNQKKFFVYLPSILQDDKTQIKNALITQNGSPAEEYLYEGNLILVWYHPLNIYISKKPPLASVIQFDILNILI